ncbi:MAG TPA: type II secretion system F family protein [Jatrophihabitans sp.]|nr:type II secretion system F family protein [Jatrophihabitans sp.]
MLIIGIIALVAAITIMVFLVGSRTVGRTEVVAAAPEAPFRSAFPVPRSGVDPGQPLPPLLKRFESLAVRITPSGYSRKLQHKLDLAGNPRNWGAERVLAFKGAGLTIGLVLGILVGAPHGAAVVLFAVIGGLLGFFLPDVWIRNLGERRQQELVRALPDAIDMMTVCVEAGLGFDAALSRVALNLDGPVASEFARVLQEMQFGKSRTEALRALVDRTDVAELRTFVSSLIQSTELGISVGDVLREQAKEMRVRRRQRAEEQAQKLPVKILFPLLFCMLPSMFVVVLGPAVMSIVHTLGLLNR